MHRPVVACAQSCFVCLRGIRANAYTTILQSARVDRSRRLACPSQNNEKIASCGSDGLIKQWVRVHSVVQRLTGSFSVLLVHNLVIQPFLSRPVPLLVGSPLHPLPISSVTPATSYPMPPSNIAVYSSLSSCFFCSAAGIKVQHRCCDNGGSQADRVACDVFA